MAGWRRSETSEVLLKLTSREDFAQTVTRPNLQNTGRIRPFIPSCVSEFTETRHAMIFRTRAVSPARLMTGPSLMVWATARNFEILGKLLRNHVRSSRWMYRGNEIVLCGQSREGVPINPTVIFSLRIPLTSSPQLTRDAIRFGQGDLSGLDPA